MESFLSIFNSNGFIPDGSSFSWHQVVFYTHVASDILTGLAYYGIAVGLIYILTKRDDISYKWFIIPSGILMSIACGTSHLFSVWTIWNPDFTAETTIKFITGFVSITTTIIFWFLIKKIIALPSPQSLRLKNQKLKHEVSQHRNTKEEIQQLNVALEQRVKKRTQELEETNKKLREEINERQEAEKTIEINEQKFRNIVEGSLQGIFVHRDFKPLFANQMCADIFGYKHPNEILKMNSILEKFWVPEEQERMKNFKTFRMTGGSAPNIYEARGKRKNGESFWFESHVTLIDWQGKNAIQVAVIDISERKQVEKKLGYQARHDTLTGLINRHEFERRIKQLITTVHDDIGEHALCFMDLDQFKLVNDTCGHIAGDEMLRQLTSVLQNVVRKRDTLARLGGDEFGVLIKHCSLSDAHRVAKSLLRKVQNYQFSWEKYSFKVGVSIGLVPISKLTPNLTELLSDADVACYMAKDKGRNRIHIYHPEDSEIAQRHGEMQWVARLNQALEENSLCLYAQSIVPLNGNSNKHYEILVRILDDKGKIILPNAFLPAAERYNLVSKIDHWVIKNTFALLSMNPSFLEQITFCSINLSGQSLTTPGILEFIVGLLRESKIQGCKICFEITETAAISNLNTAIKFISTLKKIGCRFALDDFGSGLSSFAYLKNLPVDYLKIDGLFIKDIVSSPIDHAMVRSINEIGHAMGMQTIAEFVENNIIQQVLEDIGVNYAQGYGLGKPKPINEFLNN